MSNDRDDAQGRPPAAPSDTWGGPHPAQQPDGGTPGADDGRPRPPHGATAVGATAAGGQLSWAGPAQGGLAWATPPPYGQTAPYGSPYGQAQPYGQAEPYGQAQPYGQVAPYGPYGAPPVPARPGTVITAVVLGLVHGFAGVLAALLFVLGGAFADDLLDAVQDTDPTLEGTLAPSEVGVFQGVFVALGVVVLAWAVVMLWGSFLALRGGNRVLLLVGAWIAVAASTLFLVGGAVAAVTEPQGAAGVVVFLVAFLAAVAMPVLLLVRPSTAFFAAHRRRRAAVPG